MLRFYCFPYFLVVSAILIIPTISQFPPCSVCGEGKIVTNPEAVVIPPPPIEPTTCAVVELFGLNGFLSEENCTLIPLLIDTTCGCAPSSPTSTESPVSPPVTEPVTDPTDAPVVPPTPKPTRKPTLSPTLAPTMTPTKAAKKTKKKKTKAPQKKPLKTVKPRGRNTIESDVFNGN